MVDTAVSNQKLLKPPLKWAGGKRWLVPHLAPLWNEHRHRRLVEPFCGSLAVTLGLMPVRALLNDFNPHLINFFQWLQLGLELSIPMRNERDLYYRYRNRFNQLLEAGKETSREAAQLFYYLNRTGYNGLCRFNRRGLFNVPFGRYKTIRYPENLYLYRESLAGWVFKSGDFEETHCDREDFIYADPPYDVPFTQYAREGFGWEDQVRLVKWLAEHPGPTVLSNQATDRIIALYREHGFTLHFYEAPRMISCDGNRTPAKEVLALRRIDLPEK